MGGEGGFAGGIAEGSRQAAKEAEKALVAKEATQACEGEDKELPLSVGLRLAGRVDLTDGGRAGVEGGGLYASRLRAALKRRRQLGRARRHERALRWASACMHRMDSS